MADNSQRAYRDRYELDPQLAHEQREIANRFGDRVSFLRNARSVIKFGENLDIDTAASEEVWNVGGIEILPTSNTITSISSSDAGDNQTIRLSTHTLNAGAFTEVTQEVTLNGQTPVALDTPVARVERGFNASATEIVGDVWVHEGNATAGVPPIAEAHLLIRPDDQQSQKAALTVQDTDYFVITGVEASIGRGGTTARVDVDLRIQEPGGVARTRYSFGLAAGAGPVALKFNPALLVKPNSDVRFLAGTTFNDTPVKLAFLGFYAEKYS